MYPKSFIQRLRDEIPVSQIIGARVPLKKKGREFEACCPFHQEKTPSFTVNDQKGFYHCFGCSEHGDSLKFLMEYEHMTYPQAIEALAQEAGIALPEISPEAEAQEIKRQSLQDVVAMAADWFVEQLNLTHGQEARNYLLNRGLTEETIRYFRLGYSPDDRYALKHFLQNNSVEDAQMLEAGLIIKPDNGKPAYDRFRGRVMFPITDRAGNVIAFGGRIMVKSDTAPKYLNSPETPLFHKGHVLYNWKNAKNAARDNTPIIVSEGYMDVIALHSFGFTTGVAPLGTALTEMHLKGLWRYQDEPILCLDGDAAGQRAMWRSAELAIPLLQPGKTLRFLTMPTGQDPDDFLKANGAPALQKLIDSSIPLSQVIYETVTSRHGDKTPEQRAAADAELNQLCSRISHDGVKHHFQQFFREQRYANRTSIYSNKFSKKPTNIAVPTNAPTRSDGIISAQKQLLKLLILHPELMEQGTVITALEAMEFANSNLANIQHWLLEQEENPSPEVSALRDDKQTHLPKISIEENIENIWQQLLDGMTLAQIEQEIISLQYDRTDAGLQQLQALQAEKYAIEQREYA